jgi:hypothetical protein
VICLQAAFGRGALVEERLEHMARYPDETLVPPTPMPNSTTAKLAFHRASGGNRKNMRPPSVKGGVFS